MDGELDRLRRLYAAMEDEHVLDLARDMEDLTVDAKLALTDELRRRNLAPPPVAPLASPVLVQSGPAPEPIVEEERAFGFGVGVPGIFPGGEPAVEQALEPGGEVRSGMVGLISFFDGLELSRACAALEDADISPAIEEIAGDPTIGTSPRMELWVDAADIERSKLILRQKLGLFPLPEVDEAGDQEEIPAGDGTVGQFASNAEANEVRALLTQSGFAAIVDAPEDAEDAWLVKVDPAEQEAALALLARHLGVE